MEKRKKETKGRSNKENKPDADASSSLCSSRSSSRASSILSSREDTPGPLPRFRYNKEELLDIAEQPLSKKRPCCLAYDYDTTEGLWDPEKWFRSFDEERVGSPLVFPQGRERKRPNDLERDTLLKRRPSDPKTRIREEEEEGIVLSPQRRSFGTGCHVVAQTTAQRRPCSPNDAEGRDRRERRQIGSGRISISHDTHDRDFRDRESRGRFGRERERDDYRFDSFRDRRDFVERRFQNNSGSGGRRDGRRYQQEEDEPEWFRSGPTSQHDTIELQGLPNEDSNNDSLNSNGRKNHVADGKKVHANATDDQERIEDQADVDESNKYEYEENNKTVCHVLEEETLKGLEEDATALKQDFDFNDFFKIENIPGLSEIGLSEPQLGEGGSRFSQWFGMATGAGGSGPCASRPSSSLEDSRRSSINEEFSYLNDILNGSKSPGVVSPPLHQILNQGQMFSPISTPEQQQQNNLLAMLHSAKVNVKPLLSSATDNQNHGTASISLSPPENRGESSSQVEANIKALLMAGSAPSAKLAQEVQNKVLPGGKVLTLEQLEAGLMRGDNKEDSKSTSEYQNQSILNADQGKLPNSNSSVSLQSSIASGNCGRVTTLAELEASFRKPHVSQQQASSQIQQKAQPPSQITQAPQTHHLNKPAPLNLQMQQTSKASPLTVPFQAPQPLQAQLQQTKAEDMAAFNKLLSLMKNSGSLGNTPQMPVGKMLQQQQQVKLKQQQQQQQAKIQQQQMQEQILNFMKQNPSLGKPSASPLAHLQPSTSPRCPSPAVMQTSLIPQTPSSPRAPSPIMFGSQPPMHLTAPSPIHPGQLSQSTSQTLSPNTLQVGQGSNACPVIPRVPSPQELIVHTQAIMQNALLKRQLEDQKERFIRKQQDRGKSPLPPGCGAATAPVPKVFQLVSGTPIAPTVQTKNTMPPTFTPTSVIRKMASEKAEGKEKQTRELSSPSIDEKYRPPILNMIKSHNGGVGADSENGVESDLPGLMVYTPDNQLAMTPPEMSIAEDGSIRIPVPHTPTAGGGASEPAISLLLPTLLSTGEVTPSEGQPAGGNLAPEKIGDEAAAQICSSHSTFDHGQNMSAVTVPQIRLQQEIGAAQPSNSSASQITTQQPKIPRPLVGQGTMNIPPPPSPITQSSATNNQGRAIFKGQPGPHASGNRIGDAQQHQRAIFGGQTIDADKQIMRPAGTHPVHPCVSGPPPPPSPIMPHTSPFPSGAPPMPGRMAVQPGVRPVNVNPSTNAILMQQMLTSAGVQQQKLSQLNQLAALHAQAQHPQQRVLDHRLQTSSSPATHPVYQGGNASINKMMAAVASNSTVSRQTLSQTNALSTAGLNAAISRALSPQQPLSAQISNSGGGKADSLSPTTLNRNNPANLGLFLGSRQHADSNLTKWFGMDVLKQQLPTMPSLPAQGQKVLTVDEIERCQPTIIN